MAEQRVPVRRIGEAADGGRERTGRRLLEGFSLDARLALRMLVKSWGLTVVAGSAIALAIAIGASFFEVVGGFLTPVVPLPQGDRIVSLQYATDPGNAERRILHDFERWRAELTSLDHVGAFRSVDLNLISGDALPTVVPVAEITAAGFEVAHTPPLLGRYLVSSDEAPGAQRVLVLGHEAWQSKFGSDPGVVGRVVKLGVESHTIVGVMPAGFKFPINHQYWAPLRFEIGRFPPLQGPSIFVFARLAPGASMVQAQAELEASRNSMAAAYPKEYEQVKAYVHPYTREHSNVDDPTSLLMFQLARLLVSGLVVIVSANVAILMYARTTARSSEVALRGALGASRRRILMQLFVEALALSSVGAAAGLAISQFALGKLRTVLLASETVPFWLTFDLSAPTVIYALALALLAAVIFGVLPGLKVTSGPLQNVLRELGGGTKARLGGTWTFLVVAQVALAVTALPLALFVLWQVARSELVDAGFPVDQFVTARLMLGEDSLGPRGPEQNDDVWRAHLRTRQLELTERLQAEPGVTAVTFSHFIPGDIEMFRRLEFGDAALDAGRPLAAIMRAAPDLFSTYDVKIVAGRFFNPGDRDSTTDGVVVNRRFVEEFLGGAAVLGRQFRYRYSLDGDGPSKLYQVIGVIDDFPAFRLEPGIEAQATIYHPAAPGDVSPVLSVRLRGPVPEGFVGRFRQIAAELDPTLQLVELLPLSVAYNEKRRALRALAVGVATVTGSVLLLSAAGIYALMSFIVARRAREIGIRAALGAQPRSLLMSVFRRVLWQIAAGVVVGCGLSAVLMSESSITLGESGYLLAAVAVIMLAAGCMAAVGPALRSLRIHPSEALRADT
jgi:putative ABC transport system permease protein